MFSTLIYIYLLLLLLLLFFFFLCINPDLQQAHNHSQTVHHLLLCLLVSHV